MQYDRNVPTINVCGPIFHRGEIIGRVVEKPVRENPIHKMISDYGNCHDMMFPECSIKFGDKYYA